MKKLLVIAALCFATLSVGMEKKHKIDELIKKTQTLTLDKYHPIKKTEKKLKKLIEEAKNIINQDQESINRISKIKNNTKKIKYDPSDDRVIEIKRELKKQSLVLKKVHENATKNYHSICGFVMDKKNEFDTNELNYYITCLLSTKKYCNYHSKQCEDIINGRSGWFSEIEHDNNLKNLKTEIKKSEENYKKNKDIVVKTMYKIKNIEYNPSNEKVIAIQKNMKRLETFVFENIKKNLTQKDKCIQKELESTQKELGELEKQSDNFDLSLYNYKKRMLDEKSSLLQCLSDLSYRISRDCNYSQKKCENIIKNKIKNNLGWHKLPFGLNIFFSPNLSDEKKVKLLRETRRNCSYPHQIDLLNKLEATCCDRLKKPAKSQKKT